MSRISRMSRRPVLAALLGVALVAGLALPASAAFAEADTAAPPLRGSHPVRDALTSILGRPLAVPEVDDAVRLHCAPRVTDRAAEAQVAAVACEWAAGDDVAVRSWQLWNLQVRPQRGDRTLVAEVGADTHSYVDTQVAAPAVYLYAVLGLDGAGEVIARSRLQVVELEARDREVEPMRLECAAHRSGTEQAPAVTVGCGWSEITNDAAVGYVIWKSVDGGERTVLARVGLDTTEIRDDAVAFGHRYAYVVTAVDGAGEVVGRSRAETVAIPSLDRPADRPVDTVPVDTVPVDTAPVDTAPVDTAPADTVPADTARDARPVAD